MTLSINLDSTESKPKSTNPAGSTGKPINPSKSANINPLRQPKQTKKKRFNKKLFAALFVIGLTVLCGYFAYEKIQNAAEEIGINIKPSDLIGSALSNKEPELLKDQSGERTNVLIVGIDTREKNNGLQNTDTLIIASYNHTTNEVTMISIPRDVYAEVPNRDWFIKVNGIYNQLEMADEGSGLEGLTEVITDMTGVEIQYYGMVDIKGFKDTIDILGGIDVNVENSFTDYSYPADNDIDYQVVKFVAGPQTMDGATAIKYSRSRHAAGPEGSDFARARRQQIVIQAVKAKALSTETLLNPKKVLEIISTLQGNIKMSEISTDEIEAGINLLKENGLDAKTYSFVLDPSIGNSEILQTGVIPNSYSIGPKLGLGNYKDLKLFVKYALEEPELYEKNASIYVYDTGLGAKLAKAKAVEMQEQYPFLNIKYMGTLFSTQEGVQVYTNDPEGEFVSVASRFAEELDADSNEKPEFIRTRLNGEDVVILLGGEITEQAESAE